MSEPEIRKIIWQGREIEISFTANWLGGTAHHIELRCDRLLPVTETGYKSHFLPADPDLDLDMVVVLVRSWLNEAAESKSWKRAEEADRQGDLFDL